MENYYSVEQIAEMLNMHPKTIQKYLREGKLRAAKIGKNWRVSGHELSLFMEGEKIGANKAEENSSIMRETEKIKVSSVIDVTVSGKEEAIRIVNGMTAVLNVKPPEFGTSTFSAQFIEAENKVRMMLWGNPAFMESMLGSLRLFAERDNAV